MALWRRRQLMAAGLAASLVSPARASGGMRFKAIAFDAFPIFNPQSIASLAEKLFPGRGADLVSAWRLRQFEYTWLRSLSHTYADFMRITEDALVFAARAYDLTDDRRCQLLEAWMALGAWPDVMPVLRQLKQSGVELALLSNFTPAMLQGCIATAGLAGVFDHVLSTDAVKTYKPDPRAYHLGVDAIKRPKDQILFVAFAGWDAAGAKAFGYPTYWLNRAGAASEELGLTPDGAGSNLAGLLQFLDT